MADLGFRIQVAYAFLGLGPAVFGRGLPAVKAKRVRTLGVQLGFGGLG